MSQIHYCQNTIGKKTWMVKNSANVEYQQIGEKTLTNSSHLQFHITRYSCMKMVLYSFTVESMIRGYHEHKRIWENPSAEDYLLCEQEIGNLHDTHAVAIKEALG